MAKLTSSERATLPDSSFAYVDSKGQRRLPINDESHVRNALSRFDQVNYESDTARERARNRLLKAAKKHGIVPIGFIERELERGRQSPKPPDGPVTLLFTDIEGSTPLLRQLGDRYEDVLTQVRSVISMAVKSAKGVEVEVRADETFSLFHDAGAAAKAAVAMQRAMDKATWPDDRDVRIRIGLHTGRVKLTSNGYIGLAIHKASRVSSLAAGGQIICSGETKRAVGSDGVTGLSFRSLGRHELAGLTKTHLLHQLVAKGLREDFPAL